MTDTLLALFERISTTLSDRFWAVIAYPTSSDHRLFWVYLMTSALFALFVYRKTWPRNGNDTPSFLAFLFPKKVWSNASAWLDLRFFVINELTMKLIHIGLLAGTLAFTFQLITGSNELVAFNWNEVLTIKGMSISLIYLIIAIAVGDFIGFFIHYLQHKIPFLWNFHKVHHSPEVMHPLSNFREHPIDNIAYGIGIGAGYGVLMGVVALVFGYVPRPPEVLGVPLFFFLFNVGGYHLRHSHVWLRWKGNWSKVFPSPAHHHVHHSCHPDHLDKNFAFMFPIWDVLFKTYHMPDDDRDVKFGLYGVEETEYTSVWKIYTLPFRDLWRKHVGVAGPAKEASKD